MRGATLTQYGGGTVGELQRQLGAAEATSATFSLADGSTATLIDTDLEFAINAFVGPFFGIDVELEGPAMHGVDSFRDLPVTLCSLMFVRALS